MVYVAAGAHIVGPYRYHLWRTWCESGTRLLAIGLNPSTADATTDDPTLRRLVGFARDWGHGGLDLCNLFALRATDPRELRTTDDPVGDYNDASIVTAAAGAERILLCWGAFEPKLGRDTEVVELLRARLGRDLVCLGRTKAGHPRHPLYVRHATRPTPWCPTPPY